MQHCTTQAYVSIKGYWMVSIELYKTAPYGAKKAICLATRYKQQHDLNTCMY